MSETRSQDLNSGAELPLSQNKECTQTHSFEFIVF